MQQIILALMSLAPPSVFHVAATQDEAPVSEESPMQIRIRFDDTELSATLDDTPAGRAFAEMLPLDLTLTDYHGIEKVADLPAQIPTKGSPEGYDPEIGDLTVYAPWGNLAIFYRDFGYARGLIRLGRIEGSIDPLIQDGEIPVRIENANETLSSE